MTDEEIKLDISTRYIAANIPRDQSIEWLVNEITNLKALVKLGESVVEDFLPNIGKCVLQDYYALNDFLVKAKKVNLTEL